MQKTVLVVDDEPDLVEIVRSHVEEAGYSCISASNGVEGLAKAKASKPDLIVLDIAMPGMSGLQMLEYLRTTEGLTTTPVLILSAQGQTKNIFEADRLRVIDFLIKPFTREELVLAIQRSIR